MNSQESFSNSLYDDETHNAELELSAFLGAVAELFGPDQARPAANVWLDESDLMDAPPRSEIRNWHSVTIAASARVALRAF